MIAAQLLEGSQFYLKVVSVSNETSVPDDLDSRFLELAGTLYKKYEGDEVRKEMCYESWNYLKLIDCHLSNLVITPKTSSIYIENCHIEHIEGELAELVLINSTIDTADIQVKETINTVGDTLWCVALGKNCRVGYHVLNNATIVHVDHSHPLLQLRLHKNLQVWGIAPTDIPELFYQEFENPSYAESVLSSSIFRAKHNMQLSEYRKQARF